MIRVLTTNTLICNSEILRLNIGLCKLEPNFSKINSSRQMTLNLTLSAELNLFVGKLTFLLKIKLSYQEKTQALRNVLREWKTRLIGQRLSFLRARGSLKSTWNESFRLQMMSEENSKKIMLKSLLISKSAIIES